jgi:hypothetical protein
VISACLFEINIDLEKPMSPMKKKRFHCEANELLSKILTCIRFKSYVSRPYVREFTSVLNRCDIKVRNEELSFCDILLLVLNQNQLGETNVVPHKKRFSLRRKRPKLKNTT